jgi:hypothetical protein
MENILAHRLSTVRSDDAALVIETDASRAGPRASIRVTLFDPFGDCSSDLLVGYLPIQVVPQLLNVRVAQIVHHGVDLPVDVDKNSCTTSAR